MASDEGAASGTPYASENGPDLIAELTRTLQRRAVAQGSITLPAVPAMLEDYMRTCLSTFSAIGVTFDTAQTEALRDILREQLGQAFDESPRSQIVITYDAPVGHQVTYHVRSQWTSLEKTYDTWVATRQPPYFGAEPDARVWNIALEYEDPSSCPVLDIGAGAGRNTFALARRGHPVDALEVSGQFADVIRDQARTQSLGIRVLQRDALTALDYLPRDYELIVVSEVASDLRSVDELHRLLTVAATCLAEGGRLVLNAFVARAGYEPDDAARQLGQQVYTSMFTAAELASAEAGLPLELIDDTSVYDYEYEHLPSEAWPPTGWYTGWVTGQDLFAVERAKSPIELRWRVYRKIRSGES